MLNSKNICIVFFDDYPDDSRIRRYKNILNVNGYFVNIICLKSKKRASIEKNIDYNIYRLPIKKKRGGVIRRLIEYFYFNFLSFWVISYLFIFKKVNIFHVNTLPDFLVFSAFVPRLFGGKVILDFHELFPEAMIQFSKGKVSLNSYTYKILRFLENISFRFANEIIVFHDPAKDILKARIKSGKEPVTIMNCVDPNEIPEFCRKIHNKFNIVYNGVINENLNLSQVIEALSLIQKHNPEFFMKIKFLIYGYGPDINNILNKAKDYNINNVEYKGWLKYEDMIKELETASVCILPPKKDIYSDLFYSLKLTEMIYLKIPVIASRLNTYMKYYPEGCLFYYDASDSNQLAKKIILVGNNDNIIEKYTERAYNEYNKYSWDIMSKRYVSLIEKLSASPN